MTALSISLPDNVVEKSTAAANQLGISRTAFIRLAISHELKRLSTEKEQNKMGKALAQMHNDPAYQNQSYEIEAGFSEDMLPEEEAWWIK